MDQLLSKKRRINDKSEINLDFRETRAQIPPVLVKNICSQRINILFNFN